MFSWMRRRTKYVSVTMTLAVVLVMASGAYAAKRYIITSASQIKPSVLKSLHGNAGSAGPAGSQGSQGPQGPQGPQGLAGTKGEPGAPGTPGAPGKDGKEGSPWTAGGTVPSGNTLQGEWNVGGYAPEANNHFKASVSYALPLGSAPTTHYIRPGATLPAGCTGTVENPGAEKGNLCVFAMLEENSLQEFKAYGWHFPTICAWETGLCSLTSPTAEGEGSRFGFGVEGISIAPGLMEAAGTWAVTAK